MIHNKHFRKQKKYRLLVSQFKSLTKELGREDFNGFLNKFKKVLKSKKEKFSIIWNSKAFPKVNVNDFIFFCITKINKFITIYNRFIESSYTKEAFKTYCESIYNALNDNPFSIKKTDKNYGCFNDFFEYDNGILEITNESLEINPYFLATIEYRIETIFDEEYEFDYLRSAEIKSQLDILYTKIKRLNPSFKYFKTYKLINNE